MYKIIDLGAFAPGTREPSVRLLRHSLIKTASTEIQRYWDGIEKAEGKAYLWVIGVSAMEYYGCNNNGDAFSEPDLRAAHPTFVSNAHVFLHHVNKDPHRSIGRPTFSWYNPDMHRVELILEIDKSLPGATAQVERIKRGEPVYVSMGCKVAYDVCSICGNKAPTREQYCDHLRFNLKKILSDGRQVRALNPNPVFFDISIVSRPADPTACALDKLASQGVPLQEDPPTVNSAELGGWSEDRRLYTGAVDKLAELVKNVEGAVAEVRDDASPYAVIRNVAESGFSEFAYPDFDGEQLSRVGLSPAGFTLCLLRLGAPLTLGDAAWMAARHFYGEGFDGGQCAAMFARLPEALSLLAAHPQNFPDAVCPLLTSYGGELDHPGHRTLILNMLRPVARMRISLIRALTPEPLLAKVGEAFGNPPPTEQRFATEPSQVMARALSRKGENFRQIDFRDAHGHTARTTPYHLHQAQLTTWPLSSAIKGLGAALALGALGAAYTEPSLLGKLLYSSVLGLPAATLLAGPDAEQTLRSDAGEEVPMRTLMEAWKQEKSAAAAVPPKGGLRLGTVAGMAIPAALALDYAYNKWKYGPYAQENMGSVSRKFHQAGEFVQNNPLLSVAVGGMLGARFRR